MILLDNRRGSYELLRYFSPFDVPVESTRLEFGDACWPGRGQGREGQGEDWMIGVERKRIADFVSSMRERRLSGHQIPGLNRSYQMVYLLVEGIYRPGLHGELEEHRGNGWTTLGARYREVDHHLATLEMFCGVVVVRTQSPQETVAWMVSRYKWWEKDWADHRSHCQIYAPDPEPMVVSRKASYVSPEDRIRRKYGEAGVVCWRQAAQLPGIDAKAELVVDHFQSPGVMATASVKDWMQIKGIGKKTAEACVQIYGVLP